MKLIKSKKLGLVVVLVLLVSGAVAEDVRLKFNKVEQWKKFTLFKADTNLDLDRICIALQYLYHEGGYDLKQGSTGIFEELKKSLRNVILIDKDNWAKGDIYLVDAQLDIGYFVLVIELMSDTGNVEVVTFRARSLDTVE